MSRLPTCCIHGKPHDVAKALPMAKVRQTWRTPIQKALDPDPDYDWLLEIADQAAPLIRQRFLAAIQAIRGTVKEAALRDALDTGNVDEVMQVLGLAKDDLEPLRPALLAPLNDTVAEAGAAALDATPALAAQGGALAMRFDILNPHTVQAVRTYGFNLIQQISDDTRDGIRVIVANAMEFGGHPTEQARQIRSLIGLTESQADAVANFRALLEAGDRAALTRELRDRRFDGTLDRALGADSTVDLTPDQIERMVARYGERMLANRAETIARTETINAASIGTQNAWIQATESNLLDRAKVRQGWMVTPDDHLCVYCAAVPLLNPEGVKLGQDFQTPLGPTKGPTLHPLCRCVLYLMAF